MERDVVTCQGCGHVYTVRVRDDGTYVLPTNTGTCERCGTAEFTRVSEEMAESD